MKFFVVPKLTDIPTAIPCKGFPDVKYTAPHNPTKTFPPSKKFGFKFCVATNVHDYIHFNESDHVVRSCWGEQYFVDWHYKKLIPL